MLAEPYGTRTPPGPVILVDGLPVCIVIVWPDIVLHGIGLMYPLLRTSVFLTNYEKYNKTSRYKIIIFYPGTVQGTDYELFGLINDHHTYRGIVLND